MSDQPKPHPILNVEAVEFIDLRERARKRGQNPPPAGFDARLGPLGERIGARTLGYNLTVIAPGKAAFPKHSHRVNEEMFFILEGHGELRLGDAVYPVRPGDVIACPAGDAGGAHQLRNTGGGDLKFLAVSTMEYPEVCEYPDSGKYLVRTGFGHDDFVAIARSGGNLDYWDGEA